MDLGLRDKTVIVTGGGSNIGRAVSIGFAREGAKLVIADIDQAQAEKVAALIREIGGQCTTVKTDVTNWDSVQQMVRTALDAYQQIDVLVNCVGWTIDRLFVEKPREEWEKEVAVNFWSAINCVRAVIDHMIERKSGSIVSIASDAGRIGEYREVVYSGCKGGVIAMSKSLAREVGRHGIRLNVVCPGLTPGKEDEVGDSSLWKTQAVYMSSDALEAAKKVYPLRKLGQPEDTANAVIFLASDRCAGHITGQTLSVSGGYSMA
ncbi:MAG: SDR family oxidoreductase [Chloroflexi bacterium]|nr:SDR family oxidoreductase [Chloroflexota bacterium]